MSLFFSCLSCGLLWKTIFWYIDWFQKKCNSNNNIYRYVNAASQNCPYYPKYLYPVLFYFLIGVLFTFFFYFLSFFQKKSSQNTTSITKNKANVTIFFLYPHLTSLLPWFRTALTKHALNFNLITLFGLSTRFPVSFNNELFRFTSLIGKRIDVYYKLGLN